MEFVNIDDFVYALRNKGKYKKHEVAKIVKLLIESAEERMKED